MDKETVLKVIAFQEKFWEDPKNRDLGQMHTKNRDLFLQQLDTLNEQQREAVLGFYGVLGDMYFRMLCDLMENLTEKNGD